MGMRKDHEALTFKDHMDYFKEIVSPYLHNANEIGQLNIVMSVALYKENPSRFSMFAEEMRALLKIIWGNMAHVDQIEKCVWYREGNKTDLSHSMRFFLFGGLQGDWVEKLRSVLKSRLNEWNGKLEKIGAALDASPNLENKENNEKAVDLLILDVVTQLFAFLSRSNETQMCINKTFASFFNHEVIKAVLCECFINPKSEDVIDEYVEIFLDSVAVENIGWENIVLKIDGRVGNEFAGWYDFIAQMQLSCVGLEIRNDKIKILKKEEIYWMGGER